MQVKIYYTEKIVACKRSGSHQLTGTSLMAYAVTAQECLPLKSVYR